MRGMTAPGVDGCDTSEAPAGEGAACAVGGCGAGLGAWPPCRRGYRPLRASKRWW